MIDVKEFKRGLRDAMHKDAGFWDDMGAAKAGAGLATKNINPLAHPIDYLGGLYEGAKNGYAGKVMNEQTAGLQNDGVSFQKDEYGRPISVNKAETVKNYAGNMLGGLPEGIRNGISSIGDFIGNHKTPLMWGAGLLGGGYLLKKLLFDGGGNHHRHNSGPTNIYIGGNQGSIPHAPQAFEKMSQFNMPTPPGFQYPSRFANALIGPEVQQETQPVEQQQQPYNPSFSSQDPKLQRLLRDPKMHDYLTNLIKQVNTKDSTDLEP